MSNTASSVYVYTTNAINYLYYIQRFENFGLKFSTAVTKYYARRRLSRLVLINFHLKSILSLVKRASTYYITILMVLIYFSEIDKVKNFYERMMQAITMSADHVTVVASWPALHGIEMNRLHRYMQ